VRVLDPLEIPAKAKYFQLKCNILDRA